MAGYKVEICGVNTAALPLLKTEEKELLLKKIKNGDTQARERFINGNLRLVLSIVQRFSQSSENIDDLFQIGCVGMIKAIDNFDISQGVQFSTYAVPMIINGTCGTAIQSVSAVLCVTLHIKPFTRKKPLPDNIRKNRP